MSTNDDLVPILKKLRLSGLLHTLSLRTRQAVEDSLAFEEFLFARWHRLCYLARPGPVSCVPKTVQPFSQRLAVGLTRSLPRIGAGRRRRDRVGVRRGGWCDDRLWQGLLDSSPGMRKDSSERLGTEARIRLKPSAGCVVQKVAARFDRGACSVGEFRAKPGVLAAGRLEL